MTGEPPKAPVFSVVVPAWRAAAVVERAVASVLAQELADFEVIVVDDGSDDGTDRAVARCLDPRVRYAAQPHRGVCAARNHGARIAHGRYLAFLDSDDEALPGWLAAFAAGFRDPAVGVVCCGLWGIFPDRSHALLPKPSGPELQNTTSLFLAGSFAVPRHLFLELGGYWEELVHSENTELGIRLTAACAQRGLRVEPVLRPLAVYHREVEPPATIERLRGQLASSERLLQRHAAIWRSNRHALEPLLSTAGRRAARLGDLRKARSLFGRALRVKPTRLLGWLRWGATWLPPVAARRWRADLGRSDSEGRHNHQDHPLRIAAAQECAEGDSSGPPMIGRRRKTVSAFVMTFDRPEILDSTLRALLAQRQPPDRVLVFDNGTSVATREVTERWSSSGVVYRGMRGNRGPAGAACAGVRDALEADADWIWWIDDDDPPMHEEVLDRLLGVLSAHPEAAGAGAFGARWSWRTGWVVRVPDEELSGPVDVDVFGGSAHFLIRSDAARRIELPNERLFFGLEDWEYCLRLRRAGWRLLADGALTREYRAKHQRLHHRVRSGLLPRDPPDRLWRRYYTERNYIYLMRETFNRPDLARRRAISRVASCFAAWGRGPRFGARFSGFIVKAVIDGYLGRLGQGVAPRAKPQDQQPSPGSAGAASVGNSESS